MPGSMDLIITGASGQSFSKPVTVQDDPYIDTLRVNYPTLYEGTDESDALEFTAVDQYGKEIKDLFNFAPEVVDGDTLKFNDANHLTGQVTRITAPDGVNWVVKKDNINKKFTVSIKLEKDVKKGTTLVMMATTAGLKVTPTNLTVGQRTNGESIDTTIGGSLNLDPMNRDFDFNQNVRFLSSNGTVMDRVENEQYPVFLKATTNDGTGTVTDAENTYAKVMATVTDEKPAFFWTVSRGAEGKVTHTGNVNTIGSFTIEPTANANPFDGNGVITVNELTEADNTKVGLITDLNGDYKEYKPTTYYVTLYKASVNGGDYNVSVIDKQSFKLTYSPTVVKGAWQLGTRYTAKVKENRNLYADGKDSVKIQVVAEPNIGEPYSVDGKFITVTNNTDGFTVNKTNEGTTDANEITVSSTKAGTATLSVYVTEPGADQGVYTTVEVVADDVQTATKVQKDFAATKVAGNVLNSKVGEDFTDSSRTATEWTTNAALDETGTIKNTVTVKDGQMTIENGNRLGETLTLGILDQHDIPMADAKFFVDGEAFEDFWKNTLGEIVPAAGAATVTAGTTTVAGKHIIEVRSANDKIIKHYTIDLGEITWKYAKAKTKAATTVYNETQLKNAFTAGSDDTVTLGKDITLTANFGATEIETGDKLIVPAEYTLDIDGKTLTVNGKLEVSGEVADTATGGTVTGNGTVTVKKGAIYNVTSSLTLADDSLHVEKGATVKVTNLGGYVYANESIVADNIVVPGVAGAKTVISIGEGLDISTAAKTVPTIAAGAKIIVEAEEDDIAASITLGGHEFDATVDGEGNFVIDDTAKTEATAKSTAESALSDLHTALEAYKKTANATTLAALASAYKTAASAVDAYNDDYNDEDDLTNYGDLATANTAMVTADKAKLTKEALAFTVSSGASESDAKTAVANKVSSISGLCFTDWAVSGDITNFNSSSTGTVTVSLTLASAEAGENTGSITGITMTVS